MPAIKDASMVRIKQTHHAFHEYGLSAAAGPDDQVALACLHHRTYILDDDFAVKTFLYVFYFYHKPVAGLGGQQQSG